MTRWQWWATSVLGLSEGQWLLGEFDCRAYAIEQGKIDFPGEHFWITEARSSEAAKHEGADVVPFLKERNRELIYNPPQPPIAAQPETPKPVPTSWHGTAQQAIEWVLHVNRDGQEQEFLSAWQTGSAQEEWPEFYDWLETQPDERPPVFEHWNCGTGHLKAERALRVVERLSHSGRIDAETIEAIEYLSDQAGPAFARQSIGETIRDDEVPF